MQARLKFIRTNRQEETAVAWTRHAEGPRVLTTGLKTLRRAHPEPCVAACLVPMRVQTSHLACIRDNAGIVHVTIFTSGVGAMWHVASAFWRSCLSWGPLLCRFVAVFCMTATHPNGRKLLPILICKQGQPIFCARQSSQQGPD